MVLTLHSGVVSAKFGESDVLYDSCTGRLFSLNASAAAVLLALRNGADVDDMLDAIVRRTGMSSEAARKDFQTFVDGFATADLLVNDGSISLHDNNPSKPLDSDAALVATYRIGERRVRVVCHPVDIASAFRHVAAPAQVANDAPAETSLTLFNDGDGFVLLEDGEVIDRVSSDRAARWALVREVAGEGRARSKLALLHASAVQTPAGCLLLCGESGSGKSTLLAGLVHEGYPFVADDVALLERRSGFIWPTPFAISIKEPSWPLVGRMFPMLDEAPIVRFGDRVMRYLQPDTSVIAADAGQPIAAVLFVRYEEEAEAMLAPLSAKDSLERLCRGGSILPDSDDAFAEFLSLWEQVPAWRLTHGALEDAFPLIRGLCDEVGGLACISASKR